MNKSNCPSFDIKKLCYELYKLDWKREHGITHDMTTDALKSYYEEFSEDYSFEDYLRDFGYEGKVYVCFDEFLANEYLEEEYICKLLDNTNLIDLYLQNIHPVPKGDACKTLCFTQEEFKTLFASIFGKYNVDVDEKDKLYNEINVEFDTERADGGIYFCAISDEDVYDRISDRLEIGVINIHLGQGEDGIKDGPVWVVYKEPDSILVKTSHGVLSAVESPDNTYPGIDIEFQPENLSEDYEGTLPRVLFEEVDGKLRVLVWARSDIEDYTHIVRFDLEGGNEDA